MYKKYIASLDVGTTTIRCLIFNCSNFQVIASAVNKVSLLSPKLGYFEIEPKELWDQIVKTISTAIQDAHILPAELECIGICTQRATFITWDAKTGETFHNFITWKDLRADSLVEQWNSSILVRLIKSISYCLYYFLRNKRILAASCMKFMNSQITMRLMWQLNNNPDLKKAVEKKTARFGTLDSWLLYKFRKGNNDENIEHITDITSSSATGIFDPFALSWANWAFAVFSIPEDIFPKVVDNSYNFGEINKNLFGSSIKIACCMSDQAASMWGSLCFNTGDVKITMGTGTFININTGKKCLASIYGLYPLVAWKLFDKSKMDHELLYCLEGSSNDTGSVINWAIDFGLFSDPVETSCIAESLTNTDGVFFIPAFSGIGPPINDAHTATGFLGITPKTKKAHLIRAILESIVFRATQIFNCMLLESNTISSHIRINGGVSTNNFICQSLADLTNIRVQRTKNSEASALGVALVSVLNIGLIEKNIDDLRELIMGEIFTPRPEKREYLIQNMAKWENAVKRFQRWY